MKRGHHRGRRPVRDFAGLQMKGGTIVMRSGAEIRTGAWMVRGTIVSLKPTAAAADLLVCVHLQSRRSCASSEAPGTLGFTLPSKTRTEPISATPATRRFQAKGKFWCGDTVVASSYCERRWTDAG